MCTMHQGSASVNSGSRQLFDVVGFDHLGQPQMTVGESLPLQAAISRSLGFNARPGRLIAAVVPSGSEPGEKLGNFGSEPASNAADASSEGDGSDAKEGTENAGESIVANDSEIAIRTIRWKCPDTGKWLWWSESVNAKHAAKLVKRMVARGMVAEVVACKMGARDFLNQQVYGAAHGEPSDAEDKMFRVLCVPYAEGTPYLAPNQFTYQQAEEWIDTWDGDAFAWIVEDKPSTTGFGEIETAIQRAVDSGDYTQLPTLGLGLGLIKHLRQVTSAIVAGKVTSVAHIGMVARSLERFAAQCCDGREPDALGNYDCDEFERGLRGDTRDDELEAILNRWLDVGLERDFPHLFEEAEAEAATA